MNRLHMAVAIGGGVGSSLRYLLSTIIPEVEGIPFGTLTANMLGCFLLSYLSLLSSKHWRIDTILKKGLTTGLIGSFTTFSAFSTEALQLLYNNTGMGTIYILGTIFGGLLMTWLGVKAGEVKV